MGVGEEAVVEERDRGWTDVGFQLRFEAVGPQVAAPQGQPMRADVSQHRPETDEFVAVVAGFDHGQALAVVNAMAQQRGGRRAWQWPGHAVDPDCALLHHQRQELGQDFAGIREEHAPMVAVDVFDVIAIQRPEVVARRGHCGSPSVGPQAAWPSIGSSAETVRCLIPTIDARAIDSPMTRTAPVSIKQEDFIQSRSAEPTSELQSLMRISYAVFCLKKKKTTLQQK